MCRIDGFEWRVTPDMGAHRFGQVHARPPREGCRCRTGRDQARPGLEAPVCAAPAAVRNRRGRSGTGARRRCGSLAGMLGGRRGEGR
jgi:hypothetical protein